MLVYSGLKSDFMTGVLDETIAKDIEHIIYEKMHRSTPKREFRSWVNSLEKMYLVLNDSSIPENAGVAIEYNIPQTAKRVDFIVSGHDEKDTANAIIIELTQKWLASGAKESLNEISKLIIQLIYHGQDNMDYAMIQEI